MFRVFFVMAVTNSFARVKFPILGGGVPHTLDARPQENRRRGRDGVNADVRRELGRGVRSEPAGYVFFANLKSLAGKQNERVEDRAPGDLFLVEHEIKVLGSEGISGEQESAVMWIADRQRPVANELGEAIMSPVFESCRNNGDVRGRRIQRAL